jgi:hypothetical protein
VGEVNVTLRETALYMPSGWGSTKVQAEWCTASGPVLLLSPVRYLGGAFDSAVAIQPVVNMDEHELAPSPGLSRSRS